MAAIESLPPEQRAVLSLVLKQGKSYAEIASLLGVEETAVRERAHAALGALGPSEGTPPPPQRRAAVSDYLLGQLSDRDADRAREYLASSASGRAWARVVADALRPIGDGVVPEVPTAGAAATPPIPAAPPANAQPTAASRPDATAQPTAPSEPSPAPARAPRDASPTATRPSSKRAGAALLALLAAGVIALIVVLATGGSSKHKTKPVASGATGATGTPQIVAQVNLTSPLGAGGTRPAGVAFVARRGSQLEFDIAAAHLPPTTSRFGYAVWLYNSHTNAEALGLAPAVGSNGQLATVAPVPANAVNYRAIIVTRETTSQASRPGPIILSGRLSGR